MILNKSESLLNLLLRLFKQLSPIRRRQLGLTFVLMLITSLAEMVSLGSIAPFLAGVTEPERLWNQSFVQILAPVLGWQKPNDITVFFCLGFGFIALAVGIIRITMLWANLKLSNAIGSDLSTEVYRRTLYQPYQVHVDRNTSEVISVITSQVGSVTSTLQSLLQFATGFLISLGLIVTLVLVNAQLALIISVILGLVYALVIKISRRSLRINSNRIVVEQQRTIRALQEGLGAIRDVILDNNQMYYSCTFRSTDRNLRSAISTNSFLSLYPRFGLEAIGIAIIAAVAGWLTVGSSGVKVLSLLGIYALGAQRLLPAIQLIYGCWSNLVGNQDALRIVLRYLQQPIDVPMVADGSLLFERELRFDGVSFTYGQDLPNVIDNLNLSIRAGQKVGFVGATGSGKSTCLDLLMGLLPPTQGQITVDGVPLKGAILREWQKNIAHVPQNIYLADASIKENIAFGVPSNQIDLDRVKQAAQMAQISDFIESQAGSYDSFVGERGIRLSGGQRQRIGIARAMYKKAQVLVFDEATSALDNATENSVMSSINNLSQNLTILIIAHRLTTLQSCDLIFELRQGQLINQGSYKDMAKNSESFKLIDSIS